MLLGLSGGLGLYGLSVSGERLETLNRSGLESVADLQLIERHIGLAVEELEPAVRNPRRVDMETVSAQLAANTQSAQTLWEAYRQTSSASSTVLQGFDEAFAAWRGGVTGAIEAIDQANGFAAFEALNSVVLPATANIRELNSQLVDDERAGAADLVEDARQGRQQMFIAQLVLLLIGLCILVALSVFILKSVFRSLAGGALYDVSNRGR